MAASAQEKVFFSVFKDVPTPLDAIDLGYLNKALGFKSIDSKGTHLGFKVNAGPDKAPALKASLMGLLQGFDITQEFLKSIEVEPYIQNSGRAWKLKEQPIGGSARGDSQFAFGRVLWQSKSVWPVAYANWFSQLDRLVEAYKAIYEVVRGENGARLEASGYAAENISVFAEFPRNLPTRQHYAWASLGAWLGGAINVQYFLYHATMKQIHSAQENSEQLVLMGMAAAVNALDGSGLIGVAEDVYVALMHAQGECTVFGSLPLSEMNLANLPKADSQPLAAPLDEPERFSGVLVDKYYRMSFPARELDGRGTYGAADVCRDQFAGFYETFPANGLLRCKHFCIPIIDVSSTDEIRDILSSIPRLNDNKVVLRGQRKMHMLRRDPAIRQFLFANSCADEPSLITAAARERSYIYEDSHFALRRFLERRVYSSDKSGLSERIERWREEAKSPLCKLDYAVMALAQHYGIPTHGLDVTQNPEVAIWFATNVFSRDANTGLFRYDALQPENWASSLQDMPVVFACQAVTNTVSSSLIDCEELVEFGFTATRPLAQSASFFHGGHSDHQNRLAETLVCAFRLRPAAYDLEVSFESLFPSPAEDPGYKLMLDFSATNSGRWEKYVTRFHADS